MGAAIKPLILELLEVRPRTVAEIAAALYNGCTDRAECMAVYAHISQLRRRGVPILGEPVEAPLGGTRSLVRYRLGCKQV